MKKIKQKAINAIKKLDIYSPYPLLYKFRMTRNEQYIFNKYIKNSNNYLEFGSGGSTLRVLQKSKAKVYSVESSSDWISYLSKYFIIRKATNKRLFFHHVDIGQTGRWGFPVSKDLENLFPNYSNSIFKSLDSNNIDTVLIDGRFRVACVLSVILNRASNDNISILIHDFWNRKDYHTVLKYLTEVDKMDTLGVFKIKDNLDLVLVKEDYNIYKYVAD
ncbi:hypothetical protein [Bizionia myxarmorum]|uniref:Class I SAM-dependent methyltransferase n=1 Tax=Bizionia myxarmorum TaxID=291186 RepID=A0A5D0R5T2_9FLAO|nr:hypothetical protein [Bizionia myxarmorum]TYB77000.1 hypothetical protein ES674_09870 [Bizionia myxarmorum]